MSHCFRELTDLATYVTTSSIDINCKGLNGRESPVSRLILNPHLPGPISIYKSNEVQLIGVGGYKAGIKILSGDTIWKQNAEDNSTDSLWI